MIAEFLRTYNDLVDDHRRQALLAYASLVVETRSSTRDERRRATQMLDWWLDSAQPRRARLRRLVWTLPPGTATRDIEVAHRAARWAAASPERHEAALQMIRTISGRELLEVPAGIGLPTECALSR